MARVDSRVPASGSKAKKVIIRPGSRYGGRSAFFPGRAFRFCKDVTYCQAKQMPGVSSASVWRGSPPSKRATGGAARETLVSPSVHSSLHRDGVQAPAKQPLPAAFATQALQLRMQAASREAAASGRTGPIRYHGTRTFRVRKISSPRFDAARQIVVSGA